MTMTYEEISTGGGDVLGRLPVGTRFRYRGAEVEVRASNLPGAWGPCVEFARVDDPHGPITRTCLGLDPAFDGSASVVLPTQKRFRILNGSDEDVLGGAVGEGNAYLAAYGSLVRGEKPVGELEVGESTRKRYALSGQKPTVYRILRVQDADEVTS